MCLIACVRKCVRACVIFINVYLYKLNMPYITDLTDLHYSYQWDHSLLI